MGTGTGSADGQPWGRAGEVVSSLQLPAMDAMASAKEISFRRLLYSTEQQLACCQADAREDIAAGEPLEFTPSLAKLKHSLSSLEDQLVDLDRMQGALRLSSEKLALYRQHLKQLAMRLPVIRVPRYCVRPAPKTTAPPSNSLPALAIATKNPFEPTSTGSAGNHSQVSKVGPPLAGDKLSAAAKQSLATQELIQADLTDQLMAMTGSLLQHAHTTAAAVQEREGLVDNVGKQVDASLVGTKDLVQKSNEQYKRSSGGFCLTCMILLMVGMVFTAMVVYVKLTYFVGYRAPKGAHKGESIWSSVYDTCVQGVSSLMQLIPGRRDGNDEL